ncbi:hypothetical protein FVE85_3379 [Porphyridium purpureum]|uniref:Uncharacterized protein n=1 Tax=Porphyridium purpureum TaxID=35688 RepID=A0A5J4YVB3_PORPP|nr:hypothetical protein FVE85_3379 [Porphyridium purpureum]|eukprot:POR0493..scf227_4
MASGHRPHCTRGTVYTRRPGVQCKHGTAARRKEPQGGAGSTVWKCTAVHNACGRIQGRRKWSGDILDRGGYAALRPQGVMYNAEQHGSCERFRTQLTSTGSSEMWSKEGVHVEATESFIHWAYLVRTKCTGVHVISYALPRIYKAARYCLVHLIYTLLRHGASHIPPLLRPDLSTQASRAPCQLLDSALVRGASCGAFWSALWRAVSGALPSRSCASSRSAGWAPPGRLSVKSFQRVLLFKPLLRRRIRESQEQTHQRHLRTKLRLLILRLVRTPHTLKFWLRRILPVAHSQMQRAKHATRKVGTDRAIAAFRPQRNSRWRDFYCAPGASAPCRAVATSRATTAKPDVGDCRCCFPRAAGFAALRESPRHGCQLAAHSAEITTSVNPFRAE